MPVSLMDQQLRSADEVADNLLDRSICRAVSMKRA
jgi:hypothetical protein